ncbi:hypothetical protein D3C78_949900 [compost metagenome]
MSLLDNCSRSLRIMRHDDKHIHALADQALRLGNLLRIIAVGRLNLNLRSKSFSRCNKQITVTLPALLLQRIERQADYNLIISTFLRVIRCFLVSWLIVAGCTAVAVAVTAAAGCQHKQQCHDRSCSPAFR